MNHEIRAKDCHVFGPTYGVLPMVFFPSSHNGNPENPYIKTLYPLVNVYITMENHHFSWVNPLFLNGSFQ